MRRRTTVLIGLAAVVVAGGAYAGHRLATGGQVTQVGVDQALDRYRQQVGASTSVPTGGSTVATTSTVAVVSSTSAPAPTSTAPAPSGSPSSAGSSTSVDAVTTTTAAPVGTLVAPGVYQYATKGFDRVDVLTGARHDYPKVTTITVVPSGCGVRLRWDVALERWDSWDWCVEGNAIRMTGWIGYHEFFGTPGRNDDTCDGDPRPLDDPAGATWAMTCRLGDRTTSTFAGTVIERTSLPVAGVDIPVLHIRYDVDVVGESTGHQTVEGWYRTTDGLPVREHLTIATTQQTVVGSAHFDEDYTIDLLTPTPAS